MDDGSATRRSAAKGFTPSRLDRSTRLTFALPHTQICLTFTGFHEEMWQPAWGIRTALLGVQAFMAARAEAAQGVGSLDFPKEERESLAEQSRRWICAVCAEGRRNEEVLPDVEEDDLEERERLPDGLVVDPSGGKASQEDAAEASSSGSSSAPPQTPAGIAMTQADQAQRGHDALNELADAAIAAQATAVVAEAPNSSSTVALPPEAVENVPATIDPASRTPAVPAPADTIPTQQAGDASSSASPHGHSGLPSSPLDATTSSYASPAMTYIDDDDGDDDDSDRTGSTVVARGSSAARGGEAPPAADSSAIEPGSSSSLPSLARRTARMPSEQPQSSASRTTTTASTAPTRTQPQPPPQINIVPPPVAGRPEEAGPGAQRRPTRSEARVAQLDRAILTVVLLLIGLLVRRLF